jgi:hypothetical protein
MRSRIVGSSPAAQFAQSAIAAAHIKPTIPRAECHAR